MQKAEDKHSSFQQQVSRILNRTAHAAKLLLVPRDGDPTEWYSDSVLPSCLARDTCRITVSSSTNSLGIPTGTSQRTHTLIRLIPARVTCWQSYSSILSKLWQFSRCSRVTSVMRRQLSSSSTCSLSWPHVLLLRWRIPSSVINSQWDKL